MEFALICKMKYSAINDTCLLPVDKIAAVYLDMMMIFFIKLTLKKAKIFGS
jgi:hypothetical protein